MRTATFCITAAQVATLTRIIAVYSDDWDDPSQETRRKHKENNIMNDDGDDGGDVDNDECWLR